MGEKVWDELRGACCVIPVRRKRFGGQGRMDCMDCIDLVSSPKTVETVEGPVRGRHTSLKRGVNESADMLGWEQNLALFLFFMREV